MLFLTQKIVSRRQKLLDEIDQGKLTEEEALRKAFEFDPWDHIAMLGAAEACAQRGDTSAARELWWRAIRTQPADATAYVALWQSLSEAGDEPELTESLAFLVLRRATKDPDPEHSGKARELWQKMMKGVLDLDADSVFDNVRAVDLRPESEPADITQRLLPYRLAQDVIDPPSDGLSEDEVDEIVRCGSECAPLLEGVLCGGARGTLPRAIWYAVETALALLGEIGDPARLPSILEFTDVDDPDVAETAAWAAYRLAEKNPALRSLIRGVPRPDMTLTVYDLCCGTPDEEDEDLFDEEEPEAAIRPPRPGRNEPCWCGSGKKYKKCHLAADEQADRAGAAREEEAAGEDQGSAIGLLLQFVTEELNPREMERAVPTFFGSRRDELEPEEQTEFLDWFFHDYVLTSSGRTIPEEFLARRRKVEPGERRLIEGRARSRYSLFEVQSVEEGRGAHLLDLLTGETLFVEDVSISKSAVSWDCLLIRIGEEEGRRIFTGNGSKLPRDLALQLQQFAADEHRSAGGNWNQYLRANSHRIRQRCLDLQEAREQNLRVVTAEGDPLVFSKTTWEVLDREAVQQALESSDRIGAREDQEGVTVYGWFETPEAGDQPRRVLGHFRLEDDRLVLECSSRQRLDAGIKLVRDLAGGAVREMLQEFQGVESALARRGQAQATAKNEPRVPEELEREIMGKMMEEHYRKWPDVPLPALDGLTPRAASRLPEEKGRLIDLLKMIENGEETRRREGRPSYDVSALKRELGVDY